MCLLSAEAEQVVDRFLRCAEEELPTCRFAVDMKSRTMYVSYASGVRTEFCAYEDQAFQLFCDLADELAVLDVTNVVWVGRIRGKDECND